MEKNYIELEPNKIYGIPLHNGVLRIDVSCDDLYPGIDIEYVDDNEPELNKKTRPRVVIEAPIDEELKKSTHIRALIWEKLDSEDYSTAIEFKDYTKQEEQNGNEYRTDKC